MWYAEDRLRNDNNQEPMDTPAGNQTGMQGLQGEKLMLFFGTEIPLMKIAILCLMIYIVYQWIDAMLIPHASGDEMISQVQEDFSEQLLDMAGGDADLNQQEFEEE